MTIGGTFGDIIVLTPKRGKFSAAHSLACLGEDHPCARKHGHTWWMQASFAGVPDRHGILIDYAVVREVAAFFDKRDLDAEEPDNPMFGIMPTGENILRKLVEVFDARCRESLASVTVVRVVLDEDPIPGDSHRLTWVRPGSSPSAWGSSSGWVAPVRR